MLQAKKAMQEVQKSLHALLVIKADLEAKHAKYENAIRVRDEKVDDLRKELQDAQTESKKLCETKSRHKDREKRDKDKMKKLQHKLQTFHQDTDSTPPDPLTSPSQHTKKKPPLRQRKTPPPHRQPNPNLTQTQTSTSTTTTTTTTHAIEPSIPNQTAEPKPQTHAEKKKLNASSTKRDTPKSSKTATQMQQDPNDTVVETECLGGEIEGLRRDKGVLASRDKYEYGESRSHYFVVVAGTGMGRVETYYKRSSGIGGRRGC
ncbi:hypothetical protein P280DRAFT_464300 [Massarina eburnea CBS 473.64]|uniref:Uncharacterized protein n=1 Tax=Massarina eburnea CBS 473.64 TaxID=1395130 RepID=A0A6A6SEQ9_9PLEO|nr:hypothetical protein P280DRAFT_464300 [Massarina eburnea CBS 473.64]